MPKQNVTQHFIADLHPWGVSGFDTHTLDAAGEKYAYIFQIPKTGTIDRVGFRTGSVTSSQTLKVGLYTMSGGNPSTTAYGGMVAGTQASPAANTYYDVTLGTTCSATRGDFVALVVEWNGSAGNLQICAGSPTGNHDFPFVMDFTGAWNRHHRLGFNSIRYNDGSYGKIFAMPAASIAETTFNSGSTPDERGVVFTLPVAVMCQGIYSRWGSDSGSTFEVVLYEGTTALQTLSVDRANLKDNGNNFKKFIFPAGQLLAANTQYRVAFRPTNTTNCQLYALTVNTAAMLDGYAGGQNFYLTTRTNQGAWTDTTTERPFTGLIIEQLEDGSPMIMID